MNRITPIVRNLLILNIAMFALPLLGGVHELATSLLGLRFIHAPTFSIWQLVTHMFMHANFSHLLYNMLGLFFFGPLLESAWGAQRFLLFYLVTGIGAGLFYLGINYFEVRNMQSAAEAFVEAPSPEGYVAYLNQFGKGYISADATFIDSYSERPDNPAYVNVAGERVQTIYSRRINTPMIGASGAVYGILMAFGLLFPNTELFLFLIPFPIKAKYLVAIYGVTALYGAINPEAGDNVAHYAHIGGMLFGYIFYLFWKQKREYFY